MSHIVSTDRKQSDKRGCGWGWERMLILSSPSNLYSVPTPAMDDSHFSKPNLDNLPLESPEACLLEDVGFVTLTELLIITLVLWLLF